MGCVVIADGAGNHARCNTCQAGKLAYTSSLLYKYGEAAGTDFRRECLKCRGCGTATDAIHLGNHIGIAAFLFWGGWFEDPFRIAKAEKKSAKRVGSAAYGL